VPEALRRLGYSASEIASIEKHIEIHDTIEDVTADDGAVVASGLKPEHLSVFDCAFKAFKGKRSIHYKAHLGMMAAAQPFISGAISKTVNLPNEATVADIRNAYVDAWKIGLKCVAIYRDGSKRSQPLNTKKSSDKAAVAAPDTNTLELRVAELETEVTRLREVAGHPSRRRLPDTRAAYTHKFEIAGHEGYMTVGVFEDGQPGELFVTMAKEGSTIGGLMDTIGALTSMALQYGVPLDGLVRKFAHQRFEPSGFTRNPDIRSASSVIDYVFRWMACQFIQGYREATSPNYAKQPELALPGVEAEEKKNMNRPVAELARVDDGAVSLPVGIATSRKPIEMGYSGNPEGKACPSCGSTKVQKTGACHTCLNCGTSLGCS
jgi:ribonucleoside-diphosphate reductase alpha chain